MLKALLWKEWRETRLFIFLMALFVPVFSLLLNNIDYERSVKAGAFVVLYILTWIYFAVLVAANQFASEGESGTLNFLMSRPIHWMNIWLFKVIYGIICLILFGLFLFLMSLIFISPPLESVALLETLLAHSGNFTPNENFSWLLLYTSISGLYFISCVVSINMKSSFKAALMTFMVSACLLFVMLCATPELSFKASHHLFWIIFPILLFIIFIQYQHKSNLTRIAYRVFPLGGILIWVVISLRGVSLLTGGSSWALVNTGLNYYGPIINIFVLSKLPFILFGICLSGLFTSLFAFGILRREYSGWWKSLSCWNSLTVLAICFTAVLVLFTPQERKIEPAIYSYFDYWLPDRNNSNLPLVVEKNYGVQEQYLFLNRENGKVLFCGRGQFSLEYFQGISEDNRWVMYLGRKLKWGIYYKFGLWAENLDTSEQYLLMPMSDTYLTTISGGWFDGGKRFITISNNIKSRKKSLFLFSVTDSEPRKLTEMQLPFSSNPIRIDKKGKLFFYDFDKRLVSCYNRDLVKEYDINVIQEKLEELNAGSEKRMPESINHSMLKISPDGEYLIFYVEGYSESRENENQTPHFIGQVWCVSLPGGEGKKLYEVDDVLKFKNYYNSSMDIFGSPWHPLAENLLLERFISESGFQEIRLLDLKEGTVKTLFNEKSDFGSRIFSIKWSGNGKYFLTYSRTGANNEITVRLFEFDLKTLSCQIVSSKPNLKQYLSGLHLWSQDRTQAIFLSATDKTIWRLSLITGEWSKLICPFDDFTLLGISNRGEVFISSVPKAEIYRLRDKGSEIIYQGE